VTVPDRMMDGAELRDFAINTVSPGTAELRFYTEAGDLYDTVSLSVEEPARVALELQTATPAIEESDELHLQPGETLALQGVALSRAGHLMQSRSFALEIEDAQVAGFVAFAVAGEAYVASRTDSGTLVARQAGTTQLRITTAGAFRDYRVVVSP
jgi:hypothetical protein